MHQKALFEGHFRTIKSTHSSSVTITSIKHTSNKNIADTDSDTDMELQDPQSPTTPLNSSAGKELAQDMVRVINPMGGSFDVRISGDDTVASLYEKVAAQMSFGSSEGFSLVGPGGQSLDNNSSSNGSSSSSSSISSSSPLSSVGIVAGTSLRLVPRLSSGIGAPILSPQMQQIPMADLQALFGSSLNDLLLAAAQGKPAVVKVNVDGHNLQLNIQPHFSDGANEVEVSVSMDGGESASASSSPVSPSSTGHSRAAKRRSSSMYDDSSKRAPFPFDGNAAAIPPAAAMIPALFNNSSEEIRQQALASPEVRMLLQQHHDRMQELAKQQKIKDAEHSKLKTKLDDVKSMLRNKRLQKANKLAGNKAQQAGAAATSSRSSSSAAASTAAKSTTTSTSSSAAASSSPTAAPKKEARGYMGLKKGFLL